MRALSECYDLSDRPDPNTKTSRGEPVHAGVRVKLPARVNWILRPIHDERLMTLGDTVEFSNLILGTKLTLQEKRDWGHSC
jgi:hypothetical protein